MSTSFEVFPTNSYIPDCHEVISMAMELFWDFLKKENMTMNLNIVSYEMYKDRVVQESPQKLISYEDGYNSFSLNESGNVFVYFYERQEITKEFWQEEMTDNKRALNMKAQIEKNLELGYSWDVVRTAGQPALVSLFYGYVAIALAKLTDGFIYSDDGAWEYSYFPIGAEDFEKIYLNKC